MKYQYMIAFLVYAALATVALYYPQTAIWTNLLTVGIVCHVVHKQDLEIKKNAEAIKKTGDDLKTNSDNQALALKEAGNALTDTLKIAFDSLKKLTSGQGKTHTKLTDVSGRLHRLEQHLQRSLNDESRRNAIMQMARSSDKRTNDSVNRAVREDDSDE